jgi:hypothetical protein
MTSNQVVQPPIAAAVNHLTLSTAGDAPDSTGGQRRQPVLSLWYLRNSWAGDKTSPATQNHMQQWGIDIS